MNNEGIRVEHFDGENVDPNLKVGEQPHAKTFVPSVTTNSSAEPSKPGLGERCECGHAARWHAILPYGVCHFIDCKCEGWRPAPAQSVATAPQGGQQCGTAPSVDISTRKVSTAKDASPLGELLSSPHKIVTVKSVSELDSVLN